MIIILEGTNGVGKSTIAKLLHKVVDAPILRPFRPSANTHWDHSEGDTGDALRALGVPINTFVDDLYVADILRSMKANLYRGAVLDRGMPSSVAYGRLKDEEWTKTPRMDWAIKYWEDCLLEAGEQAGGVVLVYLFAPYGVTKARCGLRWHPNKTEHAHLGRTYEKVIHRSRLPVIVLQTEMNEPRTCVDKILAYGQAC